MDQDLKRMVDRLERLNPQRYRRVRDELLSSAEPERRELARWVCYEYAKHFTADDHRVLGPPAKGTVEGSFPVGTIIAGRKTYGEFGLTPSDWIQHAAIFGRPGSGKTNLLLSLAVQLARARIPWLLLDFKRNGRDLLPLLKDHGLVVFTAGRPVAPFQFNPLLPPRGVAPGAWTKLLCDVLSHAYFAGEGVEDVLLRTITDMYTDTPTPTFTDVLVKTLAVKERAREAQWKASTLRILRSLTHDGMHQVLHTTSNAAFERLLDMPVVLELDSLATSDRTFLTESLLLWLHHTRLAQNQREKFHHALLIEEAHHILTKRSNFEKESIVDATIRLSRELGQAIVLVDQHASLVGIPALGSIGTTIALNTKHDADVKALSRAMLLDENDVLGRLAIGEAVIKTSTRSHQRPFMVRIPHLPLDKGTVTDETVASRYSALFHTPSRRETPLFQQRSAPEIKETEHRNDESELLEDIKMHPDSSTRDHYKRLGWSARRGTRTKADLVTRGLALELTQTLRNGGRSIVLTLPEQRPEQRGHAEHRFRGGPEHNTHARRAFDLLQRRGFTVHAERRIDDIIVDIHAERHGATLLVLVETGKSTVETNITRAANAHSNGVLVITTNERAHERCLNFVRTHYLAHVRVIRTTNIEEEFT